MLKYEELKKWGFFYMNKTESIARKILGWKLHSSGKWYDYENETFIEEADFQPEQMLDHAMLIVKRLQQFGFTYVNNGTTQVCFNDVCATGDTLAQAITEAAALIADNSSLADQWL